MVLAKFFMLEASQFRINNNNNNKPGENLLSELTENGLNFYTVYRSFQTNAIVVLPAYMHFLLSEQERLLLLFHYSLFYDILI